MAFTDLRDTVFGESTPDGIVFSKWQQRSKTDPLLNDVYMTVDLVFANGKRFGISTKKLTIFDSQNKSYDYLPMLSDEPNIDSTYTFLSGSASQRSLTIEMDARSIDPLSIMKEIGSVSGFAEISLQKEGDLYENRYRIIVGDMVGGISFGVKEESINVQISDPKLTFDRIIPNEICSQERLPTAVSSAMGNRYPLIVPDYPYVPTLLITHFEYGPRFLVASGNVEVTGVYVSNEDAAGTKFGPTDTVNGSPGYTVSTEKDELNSLFTQIDFNFSNDSWGSNSSCYAEVSTNINIKDFSIISLIKYLAQNYSTLGTSFVDDNLFAIAHSKINNVTAKLCINGSGENNTATVTSYIESTICQSFPMISMAYTGFGYGPIVTNRKSENIVYSLVRGQNIIMDRLTSITESSRENIYNSFTFRYDYNPIEDSYNKSITLNAENSFICAHSKSMFGERENQVIDSTIVYDDETAEYIVHWLENHVALPYYTVEYSAIPAAYFNLNLGDNVYLTDDKLGIVEAVATVTKLAYTKSFCTVGLKLWFGYTKVS